MNICERIDRQLLLKLGSGTDLGERSLRVTVVFDLKGAAFAETGTGSCHLASTRARAEQQTTAS
ncbi:hypothetical protein [Streptomyces sp. NPDC003032]